MTQIMRQRDVFLESEADAWFDRNHEALANRDVEVDPLYGAVLDIYPKIQSEGVTPVILEIGCGEGMRLELFASKLGATVAGIDPSSKAVAKARARGVDARRGTAEELPWPAATFDILVFGFCLYLCDPEDLFRIASEADRVLKPNSWLLIHDFHANSFTRRSYHHKSGVYSNKMDFRRLFDWHPAYTCYSHRIAAHGTVELTDDPQEWVATSLMRKRAIEF